MSVLRLAFILGGVGVVALSFWPPLAAAAPAIMAAGTYLVGVATRTPGVE
jgi:hypothetical protein